MECRSLGRTGIRVSPIALGTWAMGGDVAVWGTTDDRESMASIHQALDCGVNLVDTAPIYGNGHAEEILGKAIAGRRNDVVIATKCGLLPSRDPSDIPQRNLTKSSIFRECDASLRRMRIEAIDIYQCHWPDPETPIRDTMEALMELQTVGKIRSIGLSNYGVERLTAALEFGPVHCVQPPFSLLNQRVAEDLLPFCRDREMGVLSYGPLAKGLLTGKFDRATTFRDLRAQDADFTGSRYERNLRLVDGLKTIAQKYDRSVGQLVINWTIRFPGITAAIVGVKRPSQVMENVGGYGWEILREDLEAIDQLVAGTA